MNFPRSWLGCVLGLGLAVSSASAAPPAAIRVGAETVPASIGAEARKTFRLAVTSSVADAGFSSRRAYTAYPTIVELRRYVEHGEKTPTVTCIVSVALTDEKQVLIATVRGSASSRGATSREVLEVATQAAVKRLVKAIESKERGRGGNKQLASR